MHERVQFDVSALEQRLLENTFGSQWSLIVAVETHGSHTESNILGS